MLEVADLVSIHPTVYPVALAGGGPEANDVRADSADMEHVRRRQGACQRGKETILATLVNELDQLRVRQAGKEVAPALDGSVQQATIDAGLGCHGWQFQGERAGAAPSVPL